MVPDKKNGKQIAKKNNKNIKKRTKKPTNKKNKSRFNLSLLKNIIILLISIAIAFYIFIELTPSKNKPFIKKKKIEKTIKKVTPKIKPKKAPKKEPKDTKIKIENLSQNQIFKLAITEYAEKYLDLPLKMGADPQKDSATDNSHLICSIYNNAAKKAGFKQLNYEPMKNLLEHSEKITIADLDNGDVIALKNGMIGMIYGKEKQDSFYLIYVSNKAKKVISLESTEFSKYWLNPKNKQGYFRLRNN